MDLLKKFFPRAFKAKDVVSLVVTIVIYALISAAYNLVVGILPNIILISDILGIIGYVLYLYSVVGVVLTILAFLKIVK